MNKLTRIQSLVTAHFAEREAYDLKVKSGQVMAYTPHGHEAMTLLRDLLPLLEAAKEWDSESDFYLERYDTTPALATEVAKLLDEVQP